MQKARKVIDNVEFWGVPLPRNHRPGSFSETEAVEQHPWRGFETSARENAGDTMRTRGIEVAEIVSTAATRLYENQAVEMLPRNVDPVDKTSTLEYSRRNESVTAPIQTDESDGRSDYDTLNQQGVINLTALEAATNSTSGAEVDWSAVEAEIESALASEDEDLLSDHDRLILMLKLAEVQGYIGKWGESLNTIRGLLPIPTSGRLGSIVYQVQALAHFAGGTDFETARRYCYRALKLAREEMKTSPETTGGTISRTNRMVQHSAYLMSEILARMHRDAESAYFKRTFLPRNYEPPASYLANSK